MAEGKVVIATELDTKSFDKQIQSVERRLEELQIDYGELSQKKGFREQSNQAIELRKEIEKTTNSLIRLREQQNKLAYNSALKSATNIQYNANQKLLNSLSLSRASIGTGAKGIQGDNFDYVAKNVKDLKNAFPDLGKAGQEAGERTGVGFEKGIRSLKRFGMALLGVRGAFTLIRRATSSYLNEHENTANKINAIWVALGNALGPIIEIIADGILKLVGYLNVFLQALGFDVDLTKNMGKSSKAIDNTTKSMKELNRQVASFDEMNVAQNDTLSGGSGSGSDAGAFKMPELDEGVVQKLKDIADWLKKNYDWLLLIAGIIGGLKLTSLLSSLIGGGTGASATGLLGISNILMTIASVAGTIGILYGLSKFTKAMRDVKDMNNEVVKTAKNVTKETIKVNEQLTENASKYEKGSKEINDYVVEMTSQINANKDLVERYKKENDEMTNLERVYDVFGKTSDKNNELMAERLVRIVDNVKGMQDLAREGKLTDDQMKIYADTMKYLAEQESHYAELEEIMPGLLKGSAREFYYNYEQIKKNDSALFGLKNNMSAIDKLIVTPKLKIQTNLDDVKASLQKLSSVSIFSGIASATLSKLRTLGLAKGGIVNNPGKGVPITNILTGEATGGTEGVVPMNNNEAMDVLGQSIAKHVVINLTNNTMLDGKVIAREQAKIQDNVNFLTNGRGV